ncbi:fused response regulator/phosphatase [Azotosporobacter soli]|uniref:fused response regulator/phosphatase n=1 Tax=Azotosporobacter soli TaxID=3055040 RepID=UPI0031FEFD9B
MWHVLVADDLPVNRTLLIKVLGKMPDVVWLEAASGSEALEIMEKEDVDLLMLDLLMPDMDGFQVMQAMRAKRSLQHIPILVHSAVQDLDSIHQALGMGAYDYFTKPLTPEQMKYIIPLKVRNALDSYGVQKELRRANELVARELRLAAAFQRRLVGEEKRICTNGSLVGLYLPCQMIGGDVYDCLQVGDAFWVMMADVSGHGMVSAMVASMVKLEFYHCVMRGGSPAEILMQMNAVFHHLTEGDVFLTAFVGQASDGVFRYANAGHPNPAWWREDAAPDFLGQDSLPLGLFAEAVYEEETCPIKDGAWLLLYTDGLLTEGNWFQADVKRRLTSLLHDCRDWLPGREKEVLEYLRQAFLAEAELKDDVAMALVRLE